MSVDVEPRADQASLIDVSAARKSRIAPGLERMADWPWWLVVAILLVLAWKVAGYYGADFILLRWLGVPWQASDGKIAAATPNSTGQFKPSTR